MILRLHYRNALSPTVCGLCIIIFSYLFFLWYSSPNSSAVNESSKVDWAISPADRAKYTQMFGALDKNKKGYLTGSRVFMESIVWL